MSPTPRSDRSTKEPTPGRPGSRSDEQPVGLYADAMIYDILHTPGTAEELDALERIAARTARTGAPTQRWLEPACGSGRCVRLAASRGTHATGFDLDPDMVAYANDRFARSGLGGTARATTADMRSFVSDGAVEPGSFDFAFNTINSFRHLMSDRDTLAHLDQISRSLAPGGTYAVGLSTCAYGLEAASEDVWQAARGTLSITQTVQFIPPTGRHGGTRVERVLSHLHIERPSGDEHRDSTYGLRTYSLDQWLDLISRSALDLIEITDHEGRPSDPGESGYRLYVLGHA